MKKFIQKFLGVAKFNKYLTQEFDKVKLISALPIVNQIKEKAGKFTNIQDAEFSVFSQWGDDGIIQYLIHTIGITNKTFIEFGVENYREANTRFLLINNNWKGLVIDGSEKNIQFIKKDAISWNYSLNAVAKFITKENLNSLIENNGFKGEIGILHIDVDGNDYWLWECLNVVNPEIVIMEYNSVFGNKAAISVPYKADFYVTNEHFSNLYFGASLKAMEHLAIKKGYTLVGSNSNGNNAYFVRNDRMNGLQKMTSDEAYVSCKFRQNRDSNHALTLVDDNIMIDSCAHLPVVNVINLETTKLKDCL